jgi:hypothetical protein
MQRFFFIFTVAAAVACASTPTKVRDSTIITAEEVEASHEANAYEVVSKLRPAFLRSRGRTTITTGASEFPSVFVDGQFYGDLNSLRTIIAPQVRLIRYYNGPDAVTRFGMLYGSGAIEVTTR